MREYMLFHDSLRGSNRSMHALPAAGRTDPGGLDRIRRRAGAVAEAQQWRRITALLQDLGLLKSQDTLIGDAFTRGISGGEKRRLSVAVELLAAPQLLFLDEPTTGALSHTPLWCAAIASKGLCFRACHHFVEAVLSSGFCGHVRWYLPV